MGRTNGRWVQDTPNPDGAIFVGATEFKDLDATATLSNTGAGLLAYALGAGAAGAFYANITAMLKRTGVFATPNLMQEQFGTAASVPGPTTVAGTTDADAIQGYPPFTAAQMPTLAGAAAEPFPKGFEITSIDVIYSIGTANIAALGLVLTDTTFTDNTAAPVVTTRLTSTTFTLTHRTNLYVKNTPVPTPAFPIANADSTQVNVNITGATTSTVLFYGVVLHGKFNYN